MIESNKGSAWPFVKSYILLCVWEGCRFEKLDRAVLSREDRQKCRMAVTSVGINGQWGEFVIVCV